MPCPPSSVAGGWHCFAKNSALRVFHQPGAWGRSLPRLSRSRSGCGSCRARLAGPAGAQATCYTRKSTSCDIAAVAIMHVPVRGVATPVVTPRRRGPVAVYGGPQPKLWGRPRGARRFRLTATVFSRLAGPPGVRCFHFAPQKATLSILAIATPSCAPGSWGGGRKNT